jgi:hypothetical protein
MKIGLFLIILIIPFTLPAQQSFQWSRSAGGPGFDMVDGIAGSGRNIFVSGGFTDQISAGNEESQGRGMRDIFLIRLDGNGDPA